MNGKDLSLSETVEEDLKPRASNMQVRRGLLPTDAWDVVCVRQ